MMRIWLLLLLITLPGLSGDDPQQDQYTQLHGDYAASHILVAHQIALRAGPNITRNKPEALERALMLLKKVKENPHLFEELAREESDGATAPKSGYLGVVSWGKFDSTFERAVKRLEPGEIIEKPILTDFGYHIIRRESPHAKNYAANLIVITYRGAINIEGIPYRRENRKQSKQAALAKLEELLPKVSAENFAEMSFQHSDFRPSGGFYGNFQKHDSITTQTLVEHFEKKAYGELTEILDLPFGYAIAQRRKVEKLAVARIIIKHDKIEDAPHWMTRPKPEAQAIADDLLKLLMADPGAFAKLAKKHSEGMYKGSGGVPPLWLAGEKEPELEEPLLKLAIEEIHSSILDLPEGLLIIKRLDPASLED